MLSHDLRSLREKFACNRSTGVLVSPSRVCDIVAILDMALGDAEALEAGSVPTAKDLPAYPVNNASGVVTSIAAYRRRRAFKCVCMPAVERPDGAA